MIHLFHMTQMISMMTLLTYIIHINQITQFISLLGMRSATPRPGPNGLEKMAKTKGPGSKGLVRGSVPKGQTLVEKNFGCNRLGPVLGGSRLDLGSIWVDPNASRLVQVRFWLGSLSVVGRSLVGVGSLWGYFWMSQLRNIAFSLFSSHRFFGD